MALVAGGLVGLGIYLLHRLGSLPLFNTAQCTAVDGTTTFTYQLEQMQNASTIAAVGVKLGVPTYGIEIAEATALQESKLYNINGGDRDSLGLFQQRPSMGWGSADQIMDTTYASTAFYQALEKVKNWQSLDLTVAAQDVQHSGYPQIGSLAGIPLTTQIFNEPTPDYYQVKYFEGIKMVSGTFSTVLGPFNVAGEVSYRHGAALAVQALELGTVNPVFSRGNTVMAQASAIYATNPHLWFDDLALVDGLVDGLAHRGGGLGGEVAGDGEDADVVVVVTLKRHGWWAPVRRRVRRRRRRGCDWR